MSTAADARILAPRADGAASKRARRAPSRPANRARPPLREQGTQERRQPGAALPWRAVACERHQHPEKAVVGPDRTGSARAGGPPPPVWLLPPSQACSPVRDGREDLFGVLPRAHLVEVRCSEPLVQVARVVGASEDGVLVDDAERAVHVEAQPLEQAARCQGSIAWPSTAAWRRTASSRTRRRKAGRKG
jgi:hypothetical protein